MSEKLKLVVLDGEKAWKLQCPQCGVWGYLDDDQFHGRISTQCDCGYHETVDWSARVDWTTAQWRN